MIYLDTSVLLRVLFREANPLAVWEITPKAVASEILTIETRRAIDRLRLEARVDDLEVARLHRELSQLEGALEIIPLTRPILERAAGPMATIVKTLDAIHLASALIFGERRRVRTSFATHDRRLATAAEALGFETIGV